MPTLVGRCIVGLAWAALGVGGCAQEPTPQPLRSLERSGRSAYLCLGAPGVADGLARPIDECRGAFQRSDALDDFGTDESGNPTNTVPHLYGLVTQTTRGEVAMVDLSLQVSEGSTDQAVVDQDKRVPGANFLPVGAQPTDIVTTPGGTAAFVSVAEVGRQGIFALPSSMIRPTPSGDRETPRLDSWPACALQSAPGSMAVLSDPPDENGDTRKSCSAPYAPDAGLQPHANGDLSHEGLGRQKLLVTLPDLGGLVIIDAQALLDRAPGTFETCPYDVWLPLRADVSPPTQDPQPEPNACVNPAPVEPGPPQSFASRPAGIAIADQHLYVADYEAPVIHVVDLPTPCEPIERPPLLPSSVEDPARVVTTSRVAVAPGVTSDLKRFLYAIDDRDPLSHGGSVMVFDVSEAPHATAPLRREHPEYTPFSPSDRIRFNIPVRDIAMVRRDIPAMNPLTGVAQEGVQCDPDPAHATCTTTSTACEVGTLYRTDTKTYEAGAGPRKLRGTFAFLVLTSGQVAVIDVEDYDAPCRGPQSPSTLSGCATDADPKAKPLVTSNEVSCNVVRPHAPRDDSYEKTADSVGRNEPGLQNFPALFDAAGTLVAADDPSASSLRAPLPQSDTAKLELAVGNEVIPIPDDGIIVKDEGPKNTLAMNLEDPRAQTTDQVWTATFEGSLLGFSGELAELRLHPKVSCTGDGPCGAGKCDLTTKTCVDPDQGLFDADSRFCSNGVQSENAVADKLRATMPAGTAEATIRKLARKQADRVQLTTELPPEKDSFWHGAACSFQSCKSSFGTVDVPAIARSFRIIEAFEDHLLLDDNEDGKVSDDEVKCCFPSLVAFDVRAGDQWIVKGETSGFLHHTIVDPATGTCRDTCDPAKPRLNGRARSVPGDQVVHDGDPAVFINPMFRFVINDCPGGCRRGLQFRWATEGGFPLLLVNLTANTKDVQPQAITSVPTGHLAITDGSLEGLMLIDPGSLGTIRQYQ